MKKYFTSVSFLILLIGLIILFTGSFSGYYGTIIYFDDNKKYLLGILFIAISLLIGYFELIKKQKKETKYSKCPKCKDTFIYSELKDGVCPTCNVKTIDIEKYYDKKFTKN